MSSEELNTQPLLPPESQVIEQAAHEAISDAATVALTRSTQAVDFALDVAEPSPTSQPTNHIALSGGYQLQEYTIGAVLGIGGFGITYLAQDNNLQCKVAIKEYLPNDLAVRTSGQSVVPRTATDNDGYRAGLERFLMEARVLATFRHHNIVRVSRFFEANSTAYMVMEYERGESLRNWVQSHGMIDENTLLRMFLPLLEGLDTVHRAGVVHRDIKPANLYVRDSDASLVLLDFGAARHTAGNSSKSLTSVLTPGYAPFEQYHARGSQGPWTDLYALGGVLYWLVTGQKPLEAPSRVKDDPMAPAVVAAAGRFSEHLLRAIDWALTVDEKQRPLTVCDFRAALTGEAAFEVPCQPVPIAVSATVAAPEPSAVASRSSRVGLAMAAVITIGGAAAYFAISSGKPAVPDVSIVTTGEKPAAPVERAGKSLAAAPNVAPSPKHKKVETTEKTTKIAAQHENPVRATDKSRAAAGATSALLTFEIVPKGESAEIMLDDRKIGRAPELREYRLPSGKHKIQITGSKAPYTYYYWVTLETGEKKNIWARFADNN